jgi:hypothetical protein
MLVCDTRAGRAVFVDGADGINAEVGSCLIFDHYLTRPSQAVMPHIVADHSLRETLAIYVDPPPRFSRTISD